MIALIHTTRLLPDALVAAFCGRPLIEWAIIQARSCAAVEKVVVASDDVQVISLAKKLGAELFASNSDLDGPEVAMAFAETGKPDSDILVLPAEAPLRRSEDLVDAVKLLGDSLVGYVLSSVVNPARWAWGKDGAVPDSTGRRLDAGLFYLLRGNCFEEGSWKGVGATVSVSPWQTQTIGDNEERKACSRLFDELVRSTYSESSARVGDLDLVVYDFDGVMTDNRVYVSQEGVETVAANRSDGLGVGWLKAAGLPQLILSTEKNPVVAARAKKLGLPVVQGIGDKAAALQRHCEASGYDLARVLFVGNDLNDEEVMKQVGHPVCPADAYPSIREIAETVLCANGGHGAIRELAELLVGAPHDRK